MERQGTRREEKAERIERRVTHQSRGLERKAERIEEAMKRQERDLDWITV